MQVKTNVRAGQGSTSTDSTSTSVDTSTTSTNSGGVNSNKPVKYTGGRCAGI